MEKSRSKSRAGTDARRAVSGAASWGKSWAASVWQWPLTWQIGLAVGWLALFGLTVHLINEAPQIHARHSRLMRDSQEAWERNCGEGIMPLAVVDCDVLDAGRRKMVAMSTLSDVLYHAAADCFNVLNVCPTHSMCSHYATRVMDAALSLGHAAAYNIIWIVLAVVLVVLAFLKLAHSRGASHDSAHGADARRLGGAGGTHVYYLPATSADDSHRPRAPSQAGGMLTDGHDADQSLRYRRSASPPSLSYHVAEPLDDVQLEPAGWV